MGANTMEKDKNKIGIIITLIIILVISLFVNFYMYFTSQKKIQLITDDFSNYKLNSYENKALLLTISDSWAEDANDDTNFLFNYWVYNFGSVEAKGLQETCNIYKDKILVYSYNDSISNTASISTKYQQSLVPVFSGYNSYDELTGACHISKCDNCIILNNKIPELTPGYLLVN